MVRCNFLKVAEPLPGNCIFTTKFPGVPDTGLIVLGMYWPSYHTDGWEKPGSSVQLV